MKTTLFDGTPTLKQGAIIGFWLLNLIVILLLWEKTGLDQLLHGGAAGAFTALGRLFGVLAAFFALTQFVLMGRLAWLERPFGLDHLASYHRKNGNLAFLFIIIHPIFIATGYGLASETSIISQYIDLIVNYQYVWLAAISQILFIAVVGTSIYIVRRRLKFENWYYVHLLVYVAIVTAFFHQVTIGSTFAADPIAKYYWYGVYIFVAANLLVWRFGLPVLNFFRYDFRVARVVAETPTTTSVYISGRHLKRLAATPGQFVFIRLLDRRFWREEHPFSLSAIASDDELRLTIRDVGDYTNKIKSLRPGARVVLSGPFGRFTKAVATTPKRLYVAGGVGITPIRGMIEDDVTQGVDSVLVYANREPNDVVFEHEIATLETKGLAVHRVFSALKSDSKQGRAGYATPELIATLVGDYKDRDVYICGPPPMMSALVDGLKAAGVSDEQLHYEVFSLH